MKRQILLQLEDSMYTVFVSVHIGPLPVLTPLTSDDIHRDATVACPVGNHYALSTMKIEELLDFVRAQYAAHAKQHLEVAQ